MASSGTCCVYWECVVLPGMLAATCGWGLEVMNELEGELCVWELVTVTRLKVKKLQGGRYE